MALDQTPHYFSKTRAYREINPDSKVGSPGYYQGLNTGVVLLHLDKMRRHEKYNKMSTVEEMITLEQKYKLNGTVGDQVEKVYTLC